MFWGPGPWDDVDRNAGDRWSDRVRRSGNLRAWTVGDPLTGSRVRSSPATGKETSIDKRRSGHGTYGPVAPPDRLLAECWCGKRTLSIDRGWVRKLRTRSCGADDCRDPRAAVRLLS